MTTREIAQATGKTERSVRNWANKVAENSSVMAEKISASTSTHPADYDLEETIAIIEAGMGKNAAAIYRANATEKSSAMDRKMQLPPKFDDPYVLRGMEYVFGAIGRLEERVKSVEEKVVPLLGYDETHMTVLGFCRTQGYTVSMPEAVRLGKEAARLSREENVEIKKVHDDRYGSVNSYHKAILQKVFAL